MHVARHSFSVMRVSLSQASMHSFMASGLSSWDLPKVAGAPPAPALPGLAALGDGAGDAPTRLEDGDGKVAGGPVAASRDGCCRFDLAERDMWFDFASSAGATGLASSNTIDLAVPTGAVSGVSEAVDLADNSEPVGDVASLLSSTTDLGDSVPLADGAGLVFFTADSAVSVAFAAGVDIVFSAADLAGSAPFLDGARLFSSAAVFPGSVVLADGADLGSSIDDLADSAPIVEGAKFAFFHHPSTDSEPFAEGAALVSSSIDLAASEPVGDGALPSSTTDLVVSVAFADGTGLVLFAGPIKEIFFRNPSTSAGGVKENAVAPASLKVATTVRAVDRSRGTRFMIVSPHWPHAPLRADCAGDPCFSIRRA